MAGYCSICGSLKIQETCLLCGSLNNNSTLEDGSGSGAGRGDASVQDHSLHRFIGVPVLSPSFYTTLCRSSSDVPVLSPSFYTTLYRSSSDVAVPPPSFFTSLCRTCSDVPVLSPSFYTTLCRSSSDAPVLSPSFYTSFCRSSSEIINFADLELSKPSTSLNLHHSPSQATGINPNISPLSPSPTKAGSTELPSPRTGVMPSGQGELLKPSSSQNLPSSPQAPWMNPNVSPLSPSPAKGASDQWPPLPVLRPAVSDLFLLSSLPTTGVLPTGHGDMPIGSPVIPQESLDQEEEEGSTEEEDEEVCIEKDGEYLRISIKCRCSKEFQLLVSGNHCYYRLT